MFSVFPNQANYSVQYSSEDISYNNRLKTALQKHAIFFRWVYINDNNGYISNILSDNPIDN